LVVPYILFSLLLPILLVFGGAGIAAVMSMPEASVYKNGDFLLWKNEVRMPFYGIVTPPSCDAILMEYLY